MAAVERKRKWDEEGEQPAEANGHLKQAKTDEDVGATDAVAQAARIAAQVRLTTQSRSHSESVLSKTFAVREG